MSRHAWLLDLQVGGQVLRYATRAVEVLDHRGVSRLYRAGLVDLGLTLDGLEEGTGLAVVDREVSWPELAAQGEALERARAELRHWTEGETIEEARLALVGGVEEPEYGDPDAPERLSLTLRVDDGLDRSWPSPSERVDTSTWARNPSGTTYDEGIEGAVYPTIFGYPGAGDTPTTTPRCCIPAPLVDWNNGALYTKRLLLARGRLDCVGGVILVADVDDPTVGVAYEDQSVIVDTDQLGQAVTLAEVPAGAGVQGDLGHAHYVGYSSDTGRGGGSPRHDGQGVMATLADVALFCLRGSGRVVDLQAQEAEREHLEVYSIDGALTEEVQLVPWFESTLMPLFPLVRARTSTGMYWRRVNYGATITDALTHLDADRGEVRRASSIRSPRGSVYNHFTISYRLVGSRPGARRTLTAEAEQVLPWWLTPDLISDARIAGSPACSRSQSAYGPRPAPAISTAYVWKTATASGILAQRALRDTFPRRAVSYTGPTSELRHLRAGDVVAVTDSEAGFARAVALVAAVALSASRQALVALEVLDPRRLG